MVATVNLQTDTSRFGTMYTDTSRFGILCTDTISIGTMGTDTIRFSSSILVTKISGYYTHPPRETE